MGTHYFNVKIDKELWESFKVKVPRTIRLNDKIVSLIRGFVESGN